MTAGVNDPRILLFANAVKVMRERQKLYFKKRDRTAMIESMDMEKQVDKMLLEIWPPQ